MAPMTPPKNGNDTTTTTTRARPSKLVVTPGILHMGEEGMYDAPISADSVGAPSQKMTKPKAISFAVMKKRKTGGASMEDERMSMYGASISAELYPMTKLKEEHVHDEDIEQPLTNVLAEEEVGEDEDKEERSGGEQQHTTTDDDDDGGDDDEDEEEIKSRPFFKLVCNLTCVSPKLVWILIGVVAIVAYSLTAFILDFQRSYWLLIVELLIGSLLVFQWVTDHYCPQQKYDLHTALVYWIDEQGNTKLAALVIGLLSIIMIGIMTTDPQNLISVVGMLVFVLLSWLLSYDSWQVNWRPVISGLLLQMLVGAMILKVPICTRAFHWLGQQVTILLNYTTAGSTFVYG